MSIFIYGPAIEEKSKKVKAITFVDDTLVTGDAAGNLLLYYDIATKNASNQSDFKKQISSKGIRKIACLHQFKVLIVLTEDQLLTMYQFPSFQAKMRIADNVENFAVHPKLDQIYVSRKHNLYLYRRIEDKLKKIPEGQLNLLNPPYILQWGGDGDFLFLGSQKQYSIIQLDKGTPQALKVEPGQIPFLKVSSEKKSMEQTSWYVYVQNNMILKLNKAEIGEFSPIELPKMSIVVGIEECGIYLICVTTFNILIYNKEKYNAQYPVQQIKVEEGYQFQSIFNPGSGSLYVLMVTENLKKLKKSNQIHSQIMRLSQIQYKLQIRAMLYKGEVEDARTMLAKYLKTDNSNRLNQFLNFNLDAGWSLFKNLDFEESVIYFSQSNIDIRELLFYYGPLLPDHKAINSTFQNFFQFKKDTGDAVEFPSLKNLYVSNASSNSMEKKQTQISLQMKTHQAYHALYEILLSKRASLLHQYQDVLIEELEQQQSGGYVANIQKVKFQQSEHSQTKEFITLKQTPLIEYLCLIDQTILKLMTISDQFKINDIRKFFKKFAGMTSKQGKKQQQSNFYQESKFGGGGAWGNSSNLYSNPNNKQHASQSHENKTNPQRMIFFNYKRLLFYLKQIEKRQFYEQDDSQIDKLAKNVKSQLTHALIQEYEQNYREAVRIWRMLGQKAKQDLDGNLTNQSDVMTQQFQKETKNYEKTGKESHVLRKRNQEILELGIAKTTNLLRKARDRDLLLEYCKWVLEISFSTSMDIFDEPKQTYSLTYDDILGKLEEVGANTTEKLNLKIQYLQRLIRTDNKNAAKKKNLENDEIHVMEGEELDKRFYTMLAQSYAERLFLHKGKHMPIQTKKVKSRAVSPDFIQLLDRFKNFLLSYDKYEASVVLDKIKESWMMEQQIVLLTREKKHRQVLQKYINNQDYQKAEAHCQRYYDEPGLLNDFFDLLIQQYQATNQMIKKDKRNAQKMGQLKNKLNEQKALIIEHLHKHCNNPYIDFSFILMKLPDDWQLQNDNLDEMEALGIPSSSYKEFTLLQFLKNGFKSKIQLNQQLKLKKDLTKMELMNTQKELAIRQQPSFKIQESTNCCVCQKKLGSKLFSIYPNGTTVHSQRCMKSPYICPVTGVNFKYNY